jgi:hypothetical protein
MAEYEDSFRVYVNVGILRSPVAEEPTQAYENIGFLLPSTTVTQHAAGWGVTPVVAGTTRVPGAGSGETQVYENVT